MDDNTIERLILAIARWEPTVNHSALRHALREFNWPANEPNECLFAAGYVRATLANHGIDVSKETIATLLEKNWLMDVDATARNLVDCIGGAKVAHVPAIRDALRAGQWERHDPHPLLPYARGVADKLRETWPWHTFSDEMLLGVLETGKPGDPSARAMAIRLADKLNLSDSMVEPIAVALRTRGWDKGIEQFPSAPAPSPILATSDVLHFPDPRRQRIEAFAMRALQGICASGPSSYFTNDRLADEAWALGQAMVDREPK